MRFSHCTCVNKGVLVCTLTVCVLHFGCHGNLWSWPVTMTKCITLLTSKVQTNTVLSSVHYFCNAQFKTCYIVCTPQHQQTVFHMALTGTGWDHLLCSMHNVQLSITLVTNLIDYSERTQFSDLLSGTLTAGYTGIHIVVCVHPNSISIVKCCTKVGVKFCKITNNQHLRCSCKDYWY